MKEVRVFQKRLGAERARDTLMRSGIPCSIVQLKGVRVSGNGMAMHSKRDLSPSGVIHITRYSVNVPDDMYEEGVWTLRDMGTPLPLMEYMFPAIKKRRRKKYIRNHENTSQPTQGDMQNLLDAYDTTPLGGMPDEISPNAQASMPSKASAHTPQSVLPNATQVASLPNAT